MFDFDLFCQESFYHRSDFLIPVSFLDTYHFLTLGYIKIIDHWHLFYSIFITFISIAFYLSNDRSRRIDRCQLPPPPLLPWPPVKPVNHQVMHQVLSGWEVGSRFHKKSSAGATGLSASYSPYFWPISYKTSEHINIAMVLVYTNPSFQ